MGQASSAPTFSACLSSVCGDRADCFATADTALYQSSWVERYNLDLPIEPIAVTRPETAEDISGFVTCAADHGIKVQAKGGGHSYANYGLGGDDGALVVDLRNFQQFSMDKTTWRATVGAGHELGDMDEKLIDAGDRAMAHGVCPSVGIGGHATIGGLGPNSRMWGAALDHVVEVEVVTADGKIQRASETENPDLFFALKGAASGFGIITEFVVDTHEAPGSVVEYTYSLAVSAVTELTDFIMEWQDLVSDPELDRRFGSELIVELAGAVVTGTFYGSEEEWNESDIPDRLPKSGQLDIFIDDWLGVLLKQAERSALHLAELSTPFTARSLAFRPEDKMSKETVQELLDYVGDARKGTLAWFLIFDASGGAVSDVAMDATAYSHRDKFMFCQAYGVGIPVLSDTTKDFISGMVESVRNNTEGTMGAYPGYVDPYLGDAGDDAYWGPNLDRLEQIKAVWDPEDVFHNPQSVRPANGSSAESRAAVGNARVMSRMFGY